MHEASLMTNLMRQIDRISQAEKANRVVTVSVWLGALSHMSPEHLAEHFVVAAKGTVAEGAQLRTTVSDDPGHPNAQDLLLQSVELDT
ncbi:hydrogenase nickel incorporation protein HypA/HybF [Enhydrobacter aerosaccus]|uniref:Hydrogenase nickel incorporation protein HypA/HybF n=1 Tax=Enhydrobacter aerosaccus TaxID=225324 RepID=A0A1T4T3Z7_9HYPH|nr:hydrogenase maturation nickel metallochaperone HypA [Enhydrobacter aerosaccus]SKA34961.1 hydrogenase nickel incorporation protein HypA/HybF [Enhydrobacter aerosaccus]